MKELLNSTKFYFFQISSSDSFGDTILTTKSVHGDIAGNVYCMGRQNCMILKVHEIAEVDYLGTWNFYGGSS